MKIQKIITWVLVLALTLSIAVGCSPKYDYPVMEEVVVDDMVLTDVRADTFSIQYDAETWTFTDESGVYFLLETSTIDDKAGPSNINITNTTSPLPIDADAVAFFTAELGGPVSIASGYTLDTCELMLLGKTPVLYMEETQIITDDIIDLYIEEGLLTKEVLEDAAALEQIKTPVHTTYLYFSVDDQLITTTGFYFDLESKDTVLEAMKLLAQTFTLN